MYFETGDEVPEDLETRRKAARAARMGPEQVEVVPRVSETAAYVSPVGRSGRTSTVS